MASSTVNLWYACGVQLSNVPTTVWQAGPTVWLGMLSAGKLTLPADLWNTCTLMPLHGIPIAVLYTGLGFRV